MILQKNLSSRSFIRLLAAAVGSFVRSFLDSSLFDGVFYFSLSLKLLPTRESGWQRRDILGRIQHILSVNNAGLVCYMANGSVRLILIGMLDPYVSNVRSMQEQMNPFASL